MGHSISPDRNAVFRSKIHIVSFSDAVEIQEFVILLQSHVNAQVVHGVHVRQARHGHLRGIYTCIAIGKGAEVRDSILMNGTCVGEGCRLYKVIAAENVTIGNGTVLGEGYDIPNDTRPDIYREGIVTLGEGTVVPAGVSIGKNVMISGVTMAEDYPGSRLESGKTLVKEGDAE